MNPREELPNKGSVLVVKRQDIGELKITTADVLRGQGADPEKIKSRNPRLYKLAAKALEEGSELLAPDFVIKEVAILEIRHKKIILENNWEISGPLIAQQLSSAQFVEAIVCTIGKSLEEYVSTISSDDLLKALAYDGLGSAAVEALANAICHQLETRAAGRGLETTIPLNPGMIGWPIEQGQPQLFHILYPSRIGVKLTSGCLMKPRKSLSMLIGVGPKVEHSGTICDFCSMRETCKYRDYHHDVNDDGDLN